MDPTKLQLILSVDAIPPVQNAMIVGYALHTLQLPEPTIAPLVDRPNAPLKSSWKPKPKILLSPSSTLVAPKDGEVIRGFAYDVTTDEDQSRLVKSMGQHVVVERCQIHLLGLGEIKGWVGVYVGEDGGGGGALAKPTLGERMIWSTEIARVEQAFKVPRTGE